jgi:HTH-type transcriptional regulator/antitoxin HigA
MILSDKQFSASSVALATLNQDLAAAQARSGAPDWLKQAEISALKSQLADLDAELAEYSLLKAGQISLSKSYSLEDLPRTLVQARIASGMSQTDLAEKLDMKPQQVQRYEATEYSGASLSRLVEVSRALGVMISGSFQGSVTSGNSVFAWTDIDDVVWTQFPHKEMSKRGWLQIGRGENPVPKVREYFQRAAGPQFASAYHRKKMRSGTVPSEYALLAWQARILERSRDVVSAGDFIDFELNDNWLPELVQLTKRADGPKLAKRLLAEKGISLIVERHLPGSYLDGAAMLDETGRPVIGLTLRHDRLDNFWFVLMHELGHVFLHLFDGFRYDYFDEESGPDNDEIETAADTFALNTLIPNEAWNLCLSRFAMSEEAVKLDAQNLDIHPSIIAGRIRKDRGNYTILNSLIGQGIVRSQLEEVPDETD